MGTAFDPSLDGAGFRRRLLAGDPLLGTFIKTPSGHATEILGEIGYDFVLVDEEHGPFDRMSIDLLMMAKKAANIAAIVRVAGPASILPALDMGADGVLIPHVDNPEAAAAAVAAARYHGGNRGFSPSPRAGRYGAFGFAEHIARGDRTASVSVMIEHPDAVRHARTIAAVDGVDGLFLGLGDLAVASGEASPDAKAIRRAAEEVARAARSSGKALIATAATIEAGAWLLDLGVSALVVSSDQGLLRAAALQQRDHFRAARSKEIQPS
jgi:2-keto-3-deoxy-L-rhamnonate aldolase RhmA